MMEDEIATFARSNHGRIICVLPLLDQLSGAHPDTPPDELVGQVDAALDRMYREGRASFAGHPWLEASPTSVAGFLKGRFSELRFDATTRRWSWSDTAWTENITVH